VGGRREGNPRDRVHAWGRNKFKDLSQGWIERLTIRYGKEGPNYNRHRTVELRTAVTPWKKRTNLQDPQDGTGAGVFKEDARDVLRVATNEDLDIVEGPTSSKAEKGAAHGAGDGDVGAPVSTTTNNENFGTDCDLPWSCSGRAYFKKRAVMAVET
jgi:hypothetical protein